MGFGWGTKSGLFRILIIALTFSPSLFAAPGDVVSFCAFVKSVSGRIASINEKFEKQELKNQADRDKALENVKGWLDDLEAAKKAFPKIFAAHVASAHTPSVDYLQKANDEIKKDLSTL